MGGICGVLEVDLKRSEVEVLFVITGKSLHGDQVVDVGGNGTVAGKKAGWNGGS